jgi:PAS domain S-box-containing protein
MSGGILTQPDYSQVLLASIVETSDDAIVSKDLNGLVTSWNKSAERIFGYTAEEMIGRPVSVLAAADRIDEFPRILERIRRGERVEHYETKRRTKTGRVIDVSLTVSPIRDAAGNVIGASKIARDISDRKLIEQAILDQAERLALSNAELQEFAYVTSHDLQEPLRTIACFAELLKQRYRGRLDADADQFIDHVVTAATRMSALIRDTLTYARIIDDNPLTLADVDSRLLVDLAIDNLRMAIEESGCVFEIGELPILRARKSGLAQVFQNLISNAIKYRSQAPLRIRIDAVADERVWLFSVADNGVGISPAYHKAIFGLFKRLDAHLSGGTGVGLALCRKIVERQGGRIWVESEPGNGSVFRFTIPRKEAGNAK